MPGRGPQTFKKRQKEQQRKERQQEKFEKRLARKHATGDAVSTNDESAADVNGGQSENGNTQEER
jgi:hypothetical protein